VRRLALGDSELARHMADAGRGLAVNLALAAVILVATLWALGLAVGVAARGIERPTAASRWTPPAELRRLAGALFGDHRRLIGVLQQLGVKATSVIAVLARLRWPSAWPCRARWPMWRRVMILILRPYRIGDEW